MLGNPYDYPYPSRRRLVYARNGMAAASHPLAVEAGVRMLAEGGNAIDAALAVAAALSVVEPSANGPGGDCFAIVHANGQLYGLNSSGRSPELFSYEELSRRGHASVPKTGWLPVSVPGAPAGWVSLSKRFGRLPLGIVFEPAVELSKGHPLSCEPAAMHNFMRRRLREAGDYPETASWWKTWSPDDKEVRPGDLSAPYELGETLRLIAETDGRAFYEGEIAHAIERYALETGGLLRAGDLKKHEARYVRPIRVNYRGVDVWELPPNGAGLTALLALNLLKRTKPVSRDDPGSVHTQMEIMKLAFADSAAHIADPAHMRVPPEALLNEAYAAERVTLVDPARAQMFSAGSPPRGDTVYFCCADREGNMISMIQSLFNCFGSGVLVPGTGMSLQNRGACFTMQKDHPNAPAPGKYPYHTIIPGFLTENGRALGPFGIMGGYMQPQAHMQVVSNLIDFGLNPQSALDAPRWCWQEGRRFSMEPAWGDGMIAALRAKGHEITVEDSVYGRGQIILRMENGTLVGASEMRADGMALGI